METITAIIQLLIYVTGSVAAVLTPPALAAAITDPQTARRLWRGLWRHLNGRPVTRPAITGHATGYREDGNR